MGAGETVSSTDAATEPAWMHLRRVSTGPVDPMRQPSASHIWEHLFRVRIDDAAAQELEEAAAWYEAEAPGTGERLLVTFESALSMLREDPLPLVSVPGSAAQLGAKRLLLHRIPFDSIVIENADELVVVAVHITLDALAIG